MNVDGVASLEYYATIVCRYRVWIRATESDYHVCKILFRLFKILVGIVCRWTQMLNAVWLLTMDPSLYRAAPANELSPSASNAVASNNRLTSSTSRNKQKPLLNPFPYPLQEEREQALRDYKVTIEYKHLKSHAPGGVYLIPSMNDLRHFYGIIFVRRGHYTNGIFKFQLRLPLRYNDVDTWPQIVFSSNVFNPYVDPNTRELDLKSHYPSWDPSKHYLVTALTLTKKVRLLVAFYYSEDVSGTWNLFCAHKFCVLTL